jgi:hypothetical protein
MNICHEAQCNICKHPHFESCAKRRAGKLLSVQPRFSISYQSFRLLRGLPPALGKEVRPSLFRRLFVFFAFLHFKLLYPFQHVARAGSHNLLEAARHSRGEGHRKREREKRKREREKKRVREGEREKKRERGSKRERDR